MYLTNDGVPQAVPYPNTPSFMDLAGLRYGRLIVLYYTGKRGNATTWLCKCDCETMTVVRSAKLKNGHTASCGCLKRETTRESGLRNRTHGYAKNGGKTAAEYRAWSAIKARCHNPKSKDYSRYGARGITVCARWRDSFENFLSDMGPRPSKGYSIDRIDNEGPYEPDNCRWATLHEQANNQRSNWLVTHKGVTGTVAEWSRAAGIKYYTFWSRLKRGWSLERALRTPVESRRQRV